MAPYVLLFYIAGFIGEFILIVNLLPVIRKKISARFLLVFIFSLVFWQSTLYLYYRIEDPSFITMIGRINFASTILLISSVFLFSISYPHGLEGKNRQISWAIMIETFVFSILTVCTKLVAVEEIIKGDARETVFGPFYFIFVLHFIVGMLGTIYTFAKTYRTEPEPFKTQVRYILWAVIIAGIFGMTTNIILPWGLNVFELQPFAPLSVILLSAVLTYVVAKHRMFDTKLVLGKTIHTLIMGSIVMGTFYLVIYFQNLIWGDVYNRNAIAAGIIISFLFIAFYQSISNALSRFLDLRLIYSTYSPQDLLNKISSSISTSLDITTIVNITEKSIIDTVRPTAFSIIVIKDKQEVVHSEYDAKTTDLLFSTIQSNNYTQIFLDDLLTGFQKIKNQQKLIEILKGLGLVLLIPINITENTIGIMVIGPKDNKRPYTVTDMDTFESMATLLSVSLGRAMLHESVQDLNKNLQKKIDDATKQLKIRNDELQDLYNNLEEIYQKEKDLMDIAGHEFRTPASILKNNLYLLKKRLSEISPDNLSDEKVEKYLRRLVEGTDRQIKLVNTFLESARIDNQRFEIEVEAHDMVEIVSEAVSEAKQFARDKGLQLIFEKPAKKMHAEVDAVRIREVIDNLINNAMKYTSQGYVEVTIKDSSDKVTVSVKDSGIGIKKEDQALLFKKFSRVENYIGGEEGSIVRPGGTGLGLYVAKTILDAHGGDIRVESEEGKGSTFTFEIPKKQPSYVRRVEGAKSKLLSQLTTK